MPNNLSPNGSFPPRSNPRQRFHILEHRINPSQIRAQLTRVMLDVPEVVEVQFAATKLPVGEARRALQGFARFGGDGFNHLLAADQQVRQRVWLVQADALDRLAFVAAFFLGVAEYERLLAPGQIQIGEEERVIGDVPERVIGDPAFPMRRAAGRDALVHHAESGVELVRENLSREFDHRGFWHITYLSWQGKKKK